MFDLLIPFTPKKPVWLIVSQTDMLYQVLVLFVLVVNNVVHCCLNLHQYLYDKDIMHLFVAICPGVVPGAGGGRGSEVDMELARPVTQADFEGAMKRVGPSITRGSEVAVSPGTHRVGSIACHVPRLLVCSGAF